MDRFMCDNRRLDLLWWMEKGLNTHDSAEATRRARPDWASPPTWRQ